MRGRTSRYYSLLSYEMDPDKPCMPDKRGHMKAVPRWRREEKWGFSEEERAPKKKKTGGAKYAGGVSERRVPEIEGAVEARRNTAGHIHGTCMVHEDKSRSI